MTRRNDMTGDT